MHTNPSYLGISYLAMSPENSSCFGLILDRGGGHHCHDVFRKLEVGLVVVSVVLLTRALILIDFGFIIFVFFVC